MIVIRILQAEVISFFQVQCIEDMIVNLLSECFFLNIFYAPLLSLSTEMTRNIGQLSIARRNHLPIESGREVRIHKTKTYRNDNVQISPV